MSILTHSQSDLRQSADEGENVYSPHGFGRGYGTPHFFLMEKFFSGHHSALSTTLWCCFGILSGGFLTSVYFLHGFLPSISVAALLLMILLTFFGLSRLGEETDIYLRNRMPAYRDFFENAVEGVFRTTPDGRYLSVNRSLAKIFGYATTEELLGPDNTISDALYVSPDRRREFQSLISEKAEVSNFISEIRRKDGTTAWIAENARAVYDKYGRVICYEGTVEDISTKIHAERMIQEALHKAEEANRAKGAFLSTMSHELRTPLNAIIGFSDIIRLQMLGPMKPETYREYASDIYSSGMHLLAIINDILDATRLEGGNVALDMKPHPLDALIHNAIESSRTLIGDQRDIILANSPNLPEVLVDGKRMAQCISKLLTNALKFTPTGGAITVRAETGSDGGMRISVIDTGIGMRPESIAEALQPFYQLDGSIARRFDGTGLGLPIAKALIELHGGTLQIKSALGEGTVATISLPPSCTLAP